MNSQGRLVPLKTLYELEIKEDLVEAYVVEIPIRLASKALNILKPVLPSDVANSSSYYFLRRLVTTTHLPPSLREDCQRQDGLATIHLLIPPPLPLVTDDIFTAFKPHIEFEPLPIVRTTRIPLNSPTSAEQASLWSSYYWPCIFNPASQPLQKAPPLNVLRTAQAELDKALNLESYFRLAETVAAECVQKQLGREIGAVVVDPETGQVIAVAGDARRLGHSDDPMTTKNNPGGLADGRPEHHALMRAIAMVAEKQERQQNGGGSSSGNAATSHYGTLQGRALTSTESLYVATNAGTVACPEESPGTTSPRPAERQESYLCHGLDVYLTHEPCIACSMAMVHSRFRACVFMRRMPGTGGLWAEKDDGGPAYGLFWRRELNWRVLTFQHIPCDDRVVGLEAGASHRADKPAEPSFHA